MKETKSLTITAGKKKSITVKGTFIKSKTFKSSKNKIATVSKKGVVAAKKAGNCKITITVRYRKTKNAKKILTKKLTCKVNVKKAAVKPTASVSPICRGQTVAPSANPTVRTVETQKDLENALKETGLRSLKLQTNAAEKFTIPAGQYKDMELTVNAPNADIENNGVFKTITVQAIKTDTWTERAKGNVFTVIAVAAHIIVAKEAEVSEITLPKIETKTKITITVEGTVGNVAVQTSTSGSAISVPVSIESTAADAEVTAKVPVAVTTAADVKVTLEKGADGSKVNTDASMSVSVKVTNKTSTSVEISTTDGTKVEDIPAGMRKM